MMTKLRNLNPLQFLRTPDITKPSGKSGIPGPKTPEEMQAHADWINGRDDWHDPGLKVVEPYHGGGWHDPGLKVVEPR